MGSWVVSGVGSGVGTGGGSGVGIGGGSGVAYPLLGPCILLPSPESSVLLPGMIDANYADLPEHMRRASKMAELKRKAKENGEKEANLCPICGKVRRFLTHHGY